jgi:hypothetical protein
LSWVSTGRGGRGEGPRGEKEEEEKTGGGGFRHLNLIRKINDKQMDAFMRQHA